MKRTILALLLVFSLLLTGIALGEGADAAANEKPAPVTVGDYLNRYPDIETFNMDGTVTETYTQVSLDTYNAFVQYLRDEKATREDNTTRARVIETGGNPVIFGDVSFINAKRKDKPAYSSEFDINSGEWKITYVDGTYSERSRTAKSLFDQMVSLTEAGQLPDAASAYRDIPDAAAYAPAAAYIADHSDLATAINHNRFQNVGDFVVFGRYEQDGDAADGPEDIEWLVLNYDKDSRRSLLISRYALDTVPYNTDYTDVTWEASSLRGWLNEDFLKEAFNDAELSAVADSEIDNSASQGSSDFTTDGGSATVDKVFLLSFSEVMDYFAEADSRKCTPTAYAVTRNAWTSPEDGFCGWWLRSPGSLPSCAMRISSDGSVRSAFVDYEEPAVRPVIWIDLNSDFF